MEDTGGKFVVDRQTLYDLGLLDDGKDSSSVFSIFNKTQWIGSGRMLESIFETPLTDIKMLRERVEILKYLAECSDFIHVSRDQLTFIEIYLSRSDFPRRFSRLSVLKKGMENLFRPNNEYYVCKRGVEYLLTLFGELDDFCRKTLEKQLPSRFSFYLNKIVSLLRDKGLQNILQQKNSSWLVMGRLDFCFRALERENIREVLDILYELDALRSVALVAAEHGFAYPVYIEEEGAVRMKELYHPCLKSAVRNDASVSREQNICFLTGPNMAGKSTYMKAWGIAVYLAHIGFPVPARSMETSVFNGLFSTINLSDNVGLGYSYYFSEILRVKRVAEEIVRLNQVVVIFDELFRGTNVKDAYDASFAVISAFAGLRKSVFIISTHILEITEQLQAFPTIDFRYFEVIMQEGKPRYTYKLLSGVSHERIGMYILNRENVVETIRRAAICDAMKVADSVK